MYAGFKKGDAILRIAIITTLIVLITYTASAGNVADDNAIVKTKFLKMCYGFVAKTKLEYPSQLQRVLSELAVRGRHSMAKKCHR